jgi:hypothetical protein
LQEVLQVQVVLQIQEIPVMLVEQGMQETQEIQEYLATVGMQEIQEIPEMLVQEIQEIAEMQLLILVETLVLAVVVVVLVSPVVLGAEMGAMEGIPCILLVLAGLAELKTVEPEDRQQLLEDEA